jgi:hypothetical protein
MVRPRGLLVIMFLLVVALYAGVVLVTIKLPGMIDGLGEWLGSRNYLWRI